MARWFGPVTLALLFCVLMAQAQPGIQEGKLKKVDVGRSIVTITTDGKDREFRVTEQTRFAADGGPGPLDLTDQRLKAGSAVQYRAVARGGSMVLVGLRLVGQGPFQGKPFVKMDTSNLKPLTELGTGKYQGFEGGLYPGGKNERPKRHEAAGLALARKVQPLDADGRPSPDGKIVLLSIGMSNTSLAFSAFKSMADADPDKAPKLVIVNGAQGGMTARRILDLEDNASGAQFWQEVDRRLKTDGVSRAQVQTAWIKEADAGPTEGFPGYARNLQKELERIVQILHERFPNLKLVYLSSRTYGGYATMPLNPEPYAYESGFSVRWLIEQQLKGDPALNYDPSKGAVRAPWLSWGPYLWANGTTKRADGLFYEARDFTSADGTHPSAVGQQKVARQLLHFFKSDTTTRPWFVVPAR